MDTFTGQDISQFPEWVAQFLSGINLYQPSEPHACRVVLHLLRGKAAEMAKNIPQQVDMNDLQELLTSLDRLFNTTGNCMVAFNLFNSYAQREDVPIQDYSLNIEHLFYRAYPGVDPTESIFLMDRFISGLVSPQIKEKLRIPPQPTTFRDAVNSAMAFTAVMFPEHQTLRQKSLAWKMAASSSHPLMTRSIHGSHKGSIQMIESSPEDENIQVIRRWCALQKTDKIPTPTAERNRSLLCQLPLNGDQPETKGEKNHVGCALNQQRTVRNFFAPLKKWKGSRSMTAPMKMTIMLWPKV